MVLVHRANVTKEAENGVSARFTIPAKQNQQLGSPVILWGRFLLDCVMMKIIPIANFNVNIYMEK